MPLQHGHNNWKFGPPQHSLHGGAWGGAEVDGKWVPIEDELVTSLPSGTGGGEGGFTTIGHRRIVCFPTVTATRLRFTVLDSKCEPVIKGTSVYLAPELTADIPDAGEKCSSNLHFFFSSPKQMMIDWDTEQTFTTFRYFPPQASKEGTVTHYTLWAKIFRFDADRLAEGERMAFDDFDICANNQ